MEFRKATYSDQERIEEIIAQAKAQMKALGSLQWQDGYPHTEDIARDIAREAGWVITEQERVIAYGAVIFDEEPAYNALEGAWLSNVAYVVVHRLAVADNAKGRGIATQFMLNTEILALGQGVQSFRVDTNFDNRYMLRMLTTLGFAYCGKIYYESGERLAFEKLLPTT